MYDDGGLSGGTMERPALQRLLADLQAGKVNVVVVYKIDRLTRSLFDFAKIVETLDGRGASFVSVTQQFNTTTSMGRLTLNVLLSFAQFEREITGERIRDKIAASKRKGMWIGGNVPLGYDARDRKLVVNEKEAETVRFIFRRYSELGTVLLLRNELDRLGIVSKETLSETGLTHGGRRMTPTHAVKKGMRYRYYASADNGNDAMEQTKPLRVPAGDVEALVADRIRALLSSPSDLGDIIAPSEFDAHVQHSIIGRAKEFVASWPQLASVPMRSLMRTAIERVTVEADNIQLHARRTGILQILGSDAENDPSQGDAAPFADDVIVLTIDAQLTRRGKGMRLVLGDAQPEATDPELENLLRESFFIRDQLLSGSDDSIEAMSKRLGLPKGYLTSRVRLTWLAPDIVAGLLKGKHPVVLTKALLLSKSRDLPCDWSQQREFLGFATA